MSQQPMVGVGVAVLTPTGYVLLKRQGSHGAGEWSFPGGHLEFNESIIDCAAREVLEELGVIVHNAHIIPVITEDFFPGGLMGKHYITVYVHAETTETPKIMEPEKASELMFVGLNSFVGLGASEWELPSPVFSGVQSAWDWVTSQYF